MALVWGILCALFVSSCCFVQLLSVPEWLNLPDVASFTTLNASVLSQMNANLLGLSSEPIPRFRWGIERNISTRPVRQALVIVRIEGLNGIGNATKIGFEQVSYSWNKAAMKLSLVLGGDLDGKTEDYHAYVSRNHTSDIEFKSISRMMKTFAAHIPSVKRKVVENMDDVSSNHPLFRHELEHLYRFAELFTYYEGCADTTDIFRFNIASLGKAPLSDYEKARAEIEVAAALYTVRDSMVSYYNNNVIIETVCIRKPIYKPTEFLDVMSFLSGFELTIIYSIVFFCGLIGAICRILLQYF